MIRAAVAVAAAVLVLFVAVPLAALYAHLSPARFAAAIGSPSALAALRISLITTSISLALTLALGTPLAYVLARARFPGRDVVDAIVDLPIVVPPAVAGLALLFVFGRYGFAAPVLDALHVRLAFTTAAVVLAQLFVGAPFYVRAARAGFAAVDTVYEEASATLGMGPLRTFARITVPLALPALAGGAVLAWARALGEFGATIMFAGNLAGVTQTLPLAVYLGLESGEVDLARRARRRAGHDRARGRRRGAHARAPRRMIELVARKTLREFTLDVELELARGVTVLAGPSGAGKSTLLRIVAGLVRPDAGRVVLGGRVLHGPGVDVPPFRRDVAYLFQEYALFPHLDVLDNVAYGLAARGVPREQRRARALEWLERLGLAALARARPRALSGGERQRAALARALAWTPRALLLDEPFAALDAATRLRVRDEVRATLAPLDVPVVLVTHDEADVAAFAAPVVRLERGRLAG